MHLIFFANMSVSFFAVLLIFCFWSTVFRSCLCSQGGQLGLLSKDVTKREEIRNQTLWPNSPVRILQYSLWVVNDLAQYHTYWVSLFSHAAVSLFLMPALAAWCYVVRSALVYNMTIGLSLKIHAIQADLSCVLRISNTDADCYIDCAKIIVHLRSMTLCFLFKKCNQMAILSSFLF